MFAPDGKLLICDILNFRIPRFGSKKRHRRHMGRYRSERQIGDEAPIAGTPLAGPRALAVDPKGNYYLALREGNSIYRMDVRTGRMSRFAGTGEKGYSGDGASEGRETLRAEGGRARTRR